MKFPFSHDSNVYDATTKHNNYIQFDPQRFKLNHLIKSQNERLKRQVQEYRRQQMMTLLKFSYMLSQKDEQIAEVGNINLKLEEYLMKLENDNQLWRKIAHENECMVLSLNNELEHMKRKTCYYPEDIECYYPEDIESCCDMKVVEEETGENNIVSDMICKACEDSLGACPVCLMEKKTSIETMAELNERPKGPLQPQFFLTNKL
ncbi:unnamed protein product [Lathyrus sativus]|nr:unnamed protein product [Lathyrus sativus]